MIIDDQLMFRRRPTAERSLLGQTVLVVEDSRLAGEALRMMCLRGGARIRRADSLRTAVRHLQTYRPSVVITDLGLPDGSGLDLIARLAGARPRVSVLVAVSGDPSMRAASMEAGADAFLGKPFGSIAQFQNLILSHLPESERPPTPRLMRDTEVIPDPNALRDDLTHIAGLLGPDSDKSTLTYASDLARGLGRSIHDPDLTNAAELLRESLNDDHEYCGRTAPLAAVVRERIVKGGGAGRTSRVTEPRAGTANAQ